MNLGKALAGPTLIPDGTGGTIEFQPLRLSEWAKIQSVVHAQQRAARGGCVKDMVDAGMKPGMVAALLRDLDRAPTSAECWDYISTIEGARQALLVSLQRGKPAATLAEVDALPLPVNELLRLALVVTGIIEPASAPGSDDEAAAGAGTSADPLPVTSTSPTG